METEQELKRLQQEAENCNSALSRIDEVGQKMESVGNDIAGAGKKMMPVTLAIGGVGVAAVKTAADFDSAMSQVAAVSGATGDDFDALREKAREMGSKTKFSASEAAEAMNYMAMAGWKTEDMLDGIEGIMNLAAASGEDLATTSDIVTDALTAFGLSAKDSGHFADILAAASSNANTNVSMMGETFKYCAPIAGAMGYSAEDTAQAIGLMANSGIKGSQAGTALRTIMTKLQGDLKLSGAAFGDMTIQTANADGSMRDLNDILADCRVAFSQMTESEKAQAAETLVGKNAMSGFLALMNAAPEDISKLESAIDNCNGTSEEMAGIMQDNLSGQLTILEVSAGGAGHILRRHPDARHPQHRLQGSGLHRQAERHGRRPAEGDHPHRPAGGRHRAAPRHHRHRDIQGRHGHAGLREARGSRREDEDGHERRNRDHGKAGCGHRRHLRPGTRHHRRDRPARGGLRAPVANERGVPREGHGDLEPRKGGFRRIRRGRKGAPRRARHRLRGRREHAEGHMGGLLRGARPRLRGRVSGHRHGARDRARRDHRPAGRLHRHLHRQLGSGLDWREGDLLVYLGGHQGHLHGCDRHPEGNPRRVPRLVRHQLGRAVVWGSNRSSRACGTASSPSSPAS